MNAGLIELSLIWKEKLKEIIGEPVRLILKLEKDVTDKWHSHPKAFEALMRPLMKSLESLSVEQKELLLHHNLLSLFEVIDQPFEDLSESKWHIGTDQETHAIFVKGSMVLSGSVSETTWNRFFRQLLDHYIHHASSAVVSDHSLSIAVGAEEYCRDAFLDLSLLNETVSGAGPLLSNPTDAISQLIHFQPSGTTLMRENSRTSPIEANELALASAPSAPSAPSASSTSSAASAASASSAAASSIVINGDEEKQLNPNISNLMTLSMRRILNANEPLPVPSRSSSDQLPALPRPLKTSSSFSTLPSETPKSPSRRHNSAATKPVSRESTPLLFSSSKGSTGSSSWSCCQIL